MVFFLKSTEILALWPSKPSSDIDQSNGLLKLQLVRQKWIDPVWEFRPV